MNDKTHSLSSAEISIFSPEISKFYKFKKNKYRLHFDTQFLILLKFFWVFKDCLKKHGYNFDGVSKSG